MEKLPDFLIVGAQKAGTTSLHAWLARQPGVSMPRDKELNFFSDDERFSRGVSWYARQFSHASARDVLGDASPNYMFVPETPERVHRLLPDAKLVFILREPVQRAFSQFLMSRRMGVESLDFPSALLAEEERTRQDPRMWMHTAYLHRSLYAEQIERFLRWFPASSCLYMKFEDLTAGGARTQTSLAKLARFIGIRPESLDLPKKNVASQTRFSLLHAWLYSSSSASKRMLRWLLPSRTWRARLAHRIDEWNRRRIDKPHIGRLPSPALDTLERDMARLEALTGLDLTDWRASMEQYRRGDER